MKYFSIQSFYFNFFGLTSFTNEHNTNGFPDLIKSAAPVKDVSEYAPKLFIIYFKCAIIYILKGGAFRLQLKRGF